MVVKLYGPRRSDPGVTERPGLDTREGGCPSLEDHLRTCVGLGGFEQTCACVSSFLLVNHCGSTRPQRADSCIGISFFFFTFMSTVTMVFHISETKAHP